MRSGLFFSTSISANADAPGDKSEMSTAAYRVGDGATNIITPLMPYFPLILIFCQEVAKRVRNR